MNGTIRHHLKKVCSDLIKNLFRNLLKIWMSRISPACSSVEKGMKFYQKNKTIKLAEGFSLRKWVNNDPVLQQYFNKKKKKEK